MSVFTSHHLSQPPEQKKKKTHTDPLRELRMFPNKDLWLHKTQQAKPVVQGEKNIFSVSLTTQDCVFFLDNFSLTIQLMSIPLKWAQVFSSLNGDLDKTETPSHSIKQSIYEI